MGRPAKLTGADLARAAGISRQAIGQSRHVKKNPDGSVDVAGTLQSIEKTESAIGRKEVALADIREMERDETAGRLIDIKEASSAWFTVTRSIRNRMLGVASSLAERLVGKSSTEIYQILDVEIREALAALRDELPNQNTADAA